jgi:hypothetical protein
MDDGLVTVAPILERVDSFAALIRAAETTGRPLGAVDFVADLERVL